MLLNCVRRSRRCGEWLSKMHFRHTPTSRSKRPGEIGDPRHVMSYHRGGQAGAVAVSYNNTSQMAPHSPSRRYSSGTTNGGTSTSGIGNTTSKLNAYRSTGSSSILDRSTGFYTSPTKSSLRSNYVSSERRSYCTSEGRSVMSKRRNLIGTSTFSLCQLYVSRMDLGEIITVSR